MDAPVNKVFTPQRVVEGAGVHLLRSIGGRELDSLDPFLLLDHFESDDPSDYEAGFPMHPHRGIETVTYILDGDVDHRDSLGNEGCIGPGCVQWMTSGGGIMHEEMPRGREGHLAGFQLWVNMPASLKLSEPRYRDVAASEIPLSVGPNAVIARVVAGDLDGVEGPVRDLYAHPLYADIEVPPFITYELPREQEHAAFAYVFRGSARFGVGAQRGNGGVLVTAPQLAVFGEGDVVRLQAEDAGVRFLFVSGKPLEEPIARYGPFVMNTREEIAAALEDLKRGTFVWRGDS